MPPIGRNDPCPCGSGMKYKHCHGRIGSAGGQSALSGASQEIAAEMARHEFPSLEAAQRHLHEYVRIRNRTPLPEFNGLSPEEMAQLLYAPFDSPGVIVIPVVLDSEPTAEILDLFMFMAESLAGGGIKLTEKGNLPRALCRAAAERFATDAGSAGPFYLDGSMPNRESDFPALRVTRKVAELAGLVRKYRGHLELTRKAKRLVQEHGARGVYPALFRAFVEDYNWAYMDGYPDLDLVQTSWAFTAYLLMRFGSETRSAGFYAEQFLNAFPAVTAEVEESPYEEPRKVVARCYQLRALERFAEFMGLVRVGYDRPTRHFAELKITRLPLLGEVVKFAGRSP